MLSPSVFNAFRINACMVIPRTAAMSFTGLLPTSGKAAEQVKSLMQELEALGVPEAGPARARARVGKARLSL